MVIGLTVPPIELAGGPADAKPPVPVTFIGALMAASPCAGVMPGTMFTVWPLIVNAPPFTVLPGKTCVPVALATASGLRLAPKPVITAGCGEPAIGLAEKVFGLISSDPGTLLSCAVVCG